MISLIAVIPHYNHSATVGEVAQQLLALGLPVLIVDDGSSTEHLAVLQQLEQQGQIWVHYCAQNGGKGAAMKVGFQLAADNGFSHALQVDADGQHNLPDALKMQQKIFENRTALICGRPIYGADAPKSRLYGRKITDFWNMINTCSLDIKDGMCGFRIYPLAQILPLIQQHHIGNRMDFDIEILIKAHWLKIPMLWVDTPVRYRQDGVSHFDAWADNVRISKMHMFLFFGMLGRWLRGKRP